MVNFTDLSEDLAASFVRVVPDYLNTPVTVKIIVLIFSQRREGSLYCRKNLMRCDI